jgi:hypothetical protein
MALRAPDKSERVTCPNCSSLLDINQGQLKFFQALKPGAFQPTIALGAVGEFPEGKLTVVGFVTRSVTFDQTYYWFEYLLYNPQLGFRWLVQSDDQWSYVKSVPIGEVREGFKKAIYQGRDFKIFQDATATVQYVTGEFYWKVAGGEQARAIDYVRPPEMLSLELSTIVPKAVYDSAGKAPINWSYAPQKTGQSGEINCSLGTFLTPQEVEKAFKINGLKRANVVAPNQPNPHKGVGKYWLAFAAALVLVGIVSVLTTTRAKVFEQSYQFQPLPNADGTQSIFSDPFTLQGRKNIAISGTSDVDNSWVYFEGDLINQDTGLVQPFSLPVEYYHGVEDGETWSEGDRTKEVFLSALPAGTYTLRLEGQWEHWEQQSPQLSVKIEQGVSHGVYWLLSLVALSAVPLVMFFKRLSFETRRWKDSMYSAGS